MRFRDRVVAFPTLEGAYRDLFLRESVDLAPAYGRARFALGTVLLHEGKRAQARAAFAAVAGDAGTDPALRNLAVAMRDAIKSR